MPALFLFLFRFFRLLVSGHQAVALENAALRLQTRGFPTKTQAASSNHLGSSVLDHPASLVVRLARSAALCSGGHGHPLAARTVSQVLGPVVQLSSPASRPACYGLADSPIDRANGDGQSIVAGATDSWRIEDAGHRHLRTHRLAHSASAFPATQSDVEDLSSQSPESNGLDRFLY